MEFADLGAHCAHPECRQQNYLPITCTNLCKKKFCEHHIRDHVCKDCMTTEEYRGAQLLIKSDETGPSKKRKPSPKKKKCLVCNNTATYKGT